MSLLPIPFHDVKNENQSPPLNSRVGARHGSRCHWCAIPVIRLYLIPPPNRIMKTERVIITYVIIYLTESREQREEEIATIDHLRRVKDAGDNRLKNLVIICYQCNQAREL